MRSSKIDKQRQQYLEFIYANNRTVEQINPAIKHIEIDYAIHWYELPASQTVHHTTLRPADSIIIHELCPNKDCTSNGFNLSGLLSTMLVQTQTEQTGTIRCDRCSASLGYSIKIEYI